jgi:hypothetical protein
MILDWIKESVFLEFIRLPNGVNRVFCPWRELLDVLGQNIAGGAGNEVISASI